MAAFEAPANADDYEADFDVEHTGGPVIEQPEHEKQNESNSNDSEEEEEEEDSDASDSVQHKASAKKQMTLKEEAAVMRKFMEKVSVCCL